MPVKRFRPTSAGQRFITVLDNKDLTKVAVTHTGALDVKDVLGYTRMILTTAAYEALPAAFEDKAKKESA